MPPILPIPSYTGTVLTGTIFSPGGQPINGWLYLRLSQDANLLPSAGGPAVIANEPPFVYQLVNGQIPWSEDSPWVYDTNDLSPSGLVYHMGVTNTGGALVLERTVSITGTTVDIGSFPAAPLAAPFDPSQSLAGDATGPGTSNVVERVQGRSHAPTAPTNGQVWAWDAANSLWKPTTLGGVTPSPLTTKGDIYVHGVTDDRLPVGINGQTIVADSTQALGVKWAAAAGAGTVTSVAPGTGLTAAPNPITSSGTVALDVPVTVPHGGSGAVTLSGLLRGNGASPITGAAQAVLTTEVTGVLPPANGGTGTSTVFADGSVPFAGASGIYSQDNARLFWDRTNHRLGLGTSSPEVQLDGTGARQLRGSGAPALAPANDTRDYFDSTMERWMASADGSRYVGVIPSDRIFNVLDYRADPSGVVDSTAAFQAAITATGGAAPRGTLYIPPGRFRLDLGTGPFVLSGLHGLVIRGAGTGGGNFGLSTGGGTTLDIRHATNSLFTADSLADFSMSGFAVDSPSVTRTGGWVLDVGGASGLIRSQIDDIRIYRQNNGIRAQEYEFVWVTRCLFLEGTGASGIAFKAGRNGVTPGGAELYFIGCQVDGMNLITGDGGATPWRTGAQLAPAIGFEIEDTHAVYCVNCGATQVKTNAVKIITSNADYGVCTQNLMFHNLVSDSTYDGDSTLVTGAGYLQQCMWVGCWFATAGSKFDVADTPLLTAAGLRIACDRFRALTLGGGGIVAANAGNGIHLAPTTAEGQIAISGNTFRDNGVTGPTAVDQNAIFYSIVAASLGPTITGNQETGSVGASVYCPAVKTVRANISSNGWVTAMSLGTAPTVNANNGPI